MRQILVTAAVILMGSYVQAQDFNYGVKGGLNLSNLRGDLDTDLRFSFHGGVYGNYMFSDLWGVQAELLYSGQGAEDEDNSDIEYQLSYLNLPILAKYYVTEAFSIELGPQFGFLLDSDTDVDDDSEIDTDDLYKDFDFSVAAGLNYELEMGLNFGARYNFGVTDNADSEAFFGNDAVRNSVMQVSVGYTFSR